MITLENKNVDLLRELREGKAKYDKMESLYNEERKSVEKLNSKVRYRWMIFLWFLDA